MRPREEELEQHPVLVRCVECGYGRDARIHDSSSSHPGAHPFREHLEDVGMGLGIALWIAAVIIAVGVGALLALV